jgi:hypothetical protein
MNPWLGSPSVPPFGVASPRQPRLSSLTSTAASPVERWLTLTFVNYNQTPQCPFPAEPVQNFIYPLHHRIIQQILGTSFTLKHRQTLQNYNSRFMNFKWEVGNNRFHSRTTDMTSHKDYLLACKPSFHSSGFG